MSCIFSRPTVLSGRSTSTLRRCAAKVIFMPEIVEWWWPAATTAKASLASLSSETTFSDYRLLPMTHTHTHTHIHTYSQLVLSGDSQPNPNPNPYNAPFVNRRHRQLICTVCRRFFSLIYHLCSHLTWTVRTNKHRSYIVTCHQQSQCQYQPWNLVWKGAVKILVNKK